MCLLYLCFLSNIQSTKHLHVVSCYCWRLGERLDVWWHLHRLQRTFKTSNKRYILAFKCHKIALGVKEKKCFCPSVLISQELCTHITEFPVMLGIALGVPSGSSWGGNAALKGRCLDVGHELKIAVVFFLCTGIAWKAQNGGVSPRRIQKCSCYESDYY